MLPLLDICGDPDLGERVEHPSRGGGVSAMKVDERSNEQERGVRPSLLVDEIEREVLGTLEEQIPISERVQRVLLPEQATFPGCIPDTSGQDEPTLDLVARLFEGSYWSESSARLKYARSASY
jgi:hypothetical protein